jgi:hypothetical protein
MLSSDIGGNLLPTTKEITATMKKNGISQLRVLSYDPRESLLPKDAERELRLSVEWMKSFGVKVDFDNFWKEAGEVIKKQGRIFPQIILLLGIKSIIRSDIRYCFLRHKAFYHFRK